MASTPSSLQVGPYPPERGRPSNSLHFVVGELSGKIDQVLLMLGRVDKLEDRVQVLEQLKWKLAGGVSLVVFLGGVVEVWFNVRPK